MTRDCCFFYCFLFSYDEEDVCNGTRHNTTVINGRMENPEIRIRSGTGEINEWFKLGSMIDINTPPPLSAFLARWMTIR